MARGVEVRTISAAGRFSAPKVETRPPPSMQALELSRWGNLRFRRGRLQSWTGSRPSGKPKDPCPHPSNATGFPSFRAIQADVLKGMISYGIGFLECEHGRASNGQHARKGIFNESFPLCQALICANLADGYFYQIGPENRRFRRPGPHRPAVCRQ